MVKNSPSGMKELVAIGFVPQSVSQVCTFVTLSSRASNNFNRTSVKEERIDKPNPYVYSQSSETFGNAMKILVLFALGVLSGFTEGKFLDASLHFDIGVCPFVRRLEGQ